MKILMKAGEKKNGKNSMAWVMQACFSIYRRGYLSEIEMKNFLSPYGFWSEFRAVDGSRPAAWNIHDAE
jgi:hypothetical protein